MGKKLRVTELQVGEGRSVHVPLIELDDGGRRERRPPAPAAGPVSIELLLDRIELLGAAVKERLEPLGPTTVSLDCGIGVGIKDGQLTALIVGGDTDVGIRLHVEWRLDRPLHG